MSNSFPQRDELTAVLQALTETAEAYLAEVDSLPVRDSRAEQIVRSFNGPLPERGLGAQMTLEKLIREGQPAAITSSGPRFFHFVVGGTTPAAMGADWLATLYDQVAYAWVSSPLAVRLEVLSLDWLKELFDLPTSWGGIMTTGATMANFVALAAARQWWGEEQGLDLAENGLAGQKAIPVFSSGYVHASAVKVLGMLGIGRASVRKLSRDARGRLDLERLAQELAAVDGPSIVIANAGEVNAGDFDPIDAMADLAEQHGAWLHVDGAFGLFARLSPRTVHLTKGVERADSVITDGHKWLNVPYDAGFAFVRDTQLLARAFTYVADYLPGPDDPRPNMGAIGPESSRRARSLAVWATLQAYGRRGHSEMVEGHLALAQQLAALVDAAPDLERLADVPLNIVCFRYNPGNRTEAELDRLNESLGAAILEDGRVFTGTTLFEGRVALRPAIVNWRTRTEDIALLVDVVRELAAEL